MNIYIGGVVKIEPSRRQSSKQAPPVIVNNWEYPLGIVDLPKLYPLPYSSSSVYQVEWSHSIFNEKIHIVFSKFKNICVRLFHKQGPIAPGLLAIRSFFIFLTYAPTAEPRKVWFIFDNIEELNDDLLTNYMEYVFNGIYFMFTIMYDK